MRSSNRLNGLSYLFVLVAGLPLAACAGGEAPPAVAPPPPAVTAPAPPPPPPAPPPVASAAPQAPPAAPKPTLSHHRYPVVALLLASLDSVQLTADQKPAIDGIQADLLKHAEVPKEPREKLQADVAAGVSAGKLDQAKIDADIRAMSAAVVATQTPMQDDLNRLHKALTPEQRKKLIETAREKGKAMHEHGMAMHEHGCPCGEHGSAGKCAGPEQGCKGCDQCGKGGEHAHEHGGKGMWEAPLAKLGEELSLTPEQSSKLRTKVEALVKAQQASMKGQMDATVKQAAAAATAFEGDKFDAKKAGVGSQTPEIVKSIAASRVQFVQAVLSVLTPEQRPKFLAHVQAHSAEME